MPATCLRLKEKPYWELPIYALKWKLLAISTYFGHTFNLVII